MSRYRAMQEKLKGNTREYRTYRRRQKEAKELINSKVKQTFKHENNKYVKKKGR